MNKMPFRKTKRPSRFMRRKRRRFVRRRRRGIVRYRKPVSHNLGLGYRHVAKLKYVTQIQLNPAQDGWAGYVFCVNGLYDPDVTGTGHQPYGFDTLCGPDGLFDHFTVIGCKVKVQFTSNSPTSGTPAWGGIVLSDDGSFLSTASSIDHILESYGVGSVKTIGFTPEGGHMPTLTKYFSARKFFGKQFIVGGADYRGSNSSNPLEKAYVEIFAGSVYGNDPGSQTALVTLEFVAVFTEPRQLEQS